MKAKAKPDGLWRGRIAVEPKPVRKQWRKSSRFRSALARANVRNQRRLRRLADNQHPFRYIPTEHMADAVFENMRRLAPWNQRLAGLPFPPNMGDTVRYPGDWEWRTVKPTFRQRLSNWYAAAYCFVTCTTNSRFFHALIPQ